MKIFITNDDGINAEGLTVLARRLSLEHEVIVCAPDKERSGASHSMSFHKPLAVRRFTSNKIRFFEVGGTPCDAVHLGMIELLKDEPPPDMLISGINNFMNLGTDCIYSGTVNAAIDGAICGVKSMAVSQECGADAYYGDAAEFVAEKLQFFKDLLPDHNTIFNINIPFPRKKDIMGAVFTTTGVRAFADSYQYIEGKGYLITGHPILLENEAHSDIIKSLEGYITVAPVKPDFNDYALFKKLKNKRIPL